MSISLFQSKRSAKKHETKKINVEQLTDKEIFTALLESDGVTEVRYKSPDGLVNSHLMDCQNNLLAKATYSEDKSRKIETRKYHNFDLIKTDPAKLPKKLDPKKVNAQYRRPCKQPFEFEHATEKADKQQQTINSQQQTIEQMQQAIQEMQQQLAQMQQQ